MGLFSTKTRRTYHRTQPSRGYSTTLKASTRLRRWFRRGRKKLWRTAKRRTKKLWRKTKQRVRRRWKQRQTPRATRQRQIARNAQQFRRHHTKVHAADQGAGQAQPSTPSAGASATCHRCHNELRYNGRRWEHIGRNPTRGHADCFRSHR